MMRYTRKKNTNDQPSEVRRLMLLLAVGLEAKDKGLIESFYLGSNVKLGCDFGDIVFVYCKKDGKPKAIFLQFKHEENDIGSEEMNLRNHLNSYVEIKKKFSETTSSDQFPYDIIECSEFVLLTNTRIKEHKKIAIKKKEEHDFLGFFQSDIFEIKTNDIEQLFQELKESIDFLSLVDALFEMYLKKELSLLNEICIKYTSFLEKYVLKQTTGVYSFRHEFLDGPTENSIVDLRNALFNKILNDCQIDAKSLIEGLKQLKVKATEHSHFKERKESNVSLITKITSDEIEHFLSRFCLIFHSPSDIELEDNIKDKIKRRFNISEVECNKLYKKVEEQIISWQENYDKDNKIDYITKENDFFKEARNYLSRLKIASSLNDTISRSKIDKIDVRFQNDSCNEFLDRIRESKAVGIAIENENVRILHITRLRQAMNESEFRSEVYHFYKVMSMSDEFDIVIEAFRTSFDLLILDLYPISKVSKQQLIDLEKTATSDVNKKIILIGEESIIKQFGISILIWKDGRVGFENLEPTTQEEILNDIRFSVQVQGRLKELMTIIPMPWNNHCHLIDANTLARIVDQDRLYNIGLKLDDSWMYGWMSRTFCRPTIDEGCFRDDRLSFVVSGLNPDQLDKLRQEAGRSNDDICHLDDGDDFNSIQDNDGRTLHWLRYIEGSYFWNESKSCLHLLQPYVDREHVELVRPKSLTDELVIIAAEPGIGITKLFSRVTDYEYDSIWRIIINLEDHLDIFSEWMDCSTEIDRNVALTFLVTVLQLDSFGKALLEYNFNSHGSISIYLDGFDKIPPSLEETVVKLVKALRKGKINKIWMSCRNQAVEKLENELDVLVFTIKSIRQSAKNRFLDKYWKNPLFLSTALAYDFVFNRSDKFYKQKTNKLLDNPLQMHMFAKGFKSICKEFVDGEKVFFKKSLSKNLNVLDIYSLFIKNELAIETGKTTVENEYLKYEKDLGYMACFSIMSENQLIELLKNIEIQEIKEKIKKINDGEEKHQMIEQIVKGKPKFVQRSFAEFFLSKMLINMLADNFESVQSFLLRFDFFYRNNTMLRLFFDYFLSKDELKWVLTNNASDIVHMKDPSILYTKDIFDRSPLYLAAFHGNAEVVKAILDKFNSNIESDCSFDGWTPMLCSINFGHWAVVDALLAHGVSSLSLFDRIGNPTKLLFLSAKKGYLHIVKVILKKHPVGYFDKFSYGRNLLMTAVQNEQLEIVEYFLSKGLDPSKCLDACAETGNVAILDKLLSATMKICGGSFKHLLEITLYTAIDNGCHIKIAEKLLKYGINVEVTSEKYGPAWTLLHVASNRGQYDIAALLVERGANQWALDRNGMTPIDAAFVNREWMTMRRLTSDERILLCSLIGENNLAEVKKLLLRRPEIINQHFFYDSSTPLHVAVRYCRLEIVQYLLEKEGQRADVLVYDSNNRSPLHYACHWQNCAKLLMKHGAKVTDCNSSGWTVLHTIAESGEAKKMQQHKKNISGVRWINLQDANGSTLLHVASSQRKVDMMKVLLKRGAEPRLIDSLGCGPALTFITSPFWHDFSDIKQILTEIWSAERRRPVSELHIAAAFRELDLVRWLIEDMKMKVDVGRGSCATPLHFAVAFQRGEIVDYLIEKGADRRAVDEVSADFRKSLMDNYERTEQLRKHCFIDNFLYIKALLSAFDHFSMNFDDKKCSHEENTTQIKVNVLMT